MEQNNLGAQNGLAGLVRKLALWLSLFLCVFIPFRTPLELATTQYVKMIPDVLIVILFVLFSVSIRFRYKFRQHDWAFIIYLVYSFFTTMLISKAGIMAYIYQVRSIGIFYVFYFILRNLDFGEKELKSIMRVLQAVAIVLCVFVVIEIVTSKTVLFPQSIAMAIWPSNYSRGYSLLANPNTFSLFLDFVIFISLFCRLCYGHKTHVAVYAVIAVGTLLSVSRSGMLILAAGLLFMLVYLSVKTHGKLPYKKLALAMVLIVAVGVVGYFGARQAAIVYCDKVIAAAAEDSASVGSMSSDVIREKTSMLGASSIGSRVKNTLKDTEIEKSNVDGRMYSLHKGLEIFKDYPVFGTGFSVFGSSSSLAFRNPIADKYELPQNFYADDEYIKLMAEGGIVGLILFGLFLASVMYYFRKDLIKILFCVFFGYFGLFYNIFEIQIGAMLFWTILALKPFPPMSTLYDKAEEA